MIWYNQIISVPETPAGSTVRLYGVYNQPGESLVPMIEIKAEIGSGPDDTATILTLYTHNPSGLGHQEDPQAEDILDRYRHKIQKATARLQNTKFGDLTLLKKL